MQQISIGGLPKSDRVFLLDSGDYFRSRFNVVRPGNACPECGCQLLGEAAVAIKIQIALCDQDGNILMDGELPLFKRKTSLTLQEEGLKKGRSEAFSEAKELLEDFVTAELAMWREFGGDEAPEL